MTNVNNRNADQAIVDDDDENTFADFLNELEEDL